MLNLWTKINRTVFYWLSQIDAACSILCKSMWVYWRLYTVYLNLYFSICRLPQAQANMRQKENANGCRNGRKPSHLLNLMQRRAWCSAELLCFSKFCRGEQPFHWGGRWQKYGWKHFKNTAEQHLIVTVKALRLQKNTRAEHPWLVYYKRCQRMS